MSELSPDEPPIATAGAARTAEQARGGTDPVAERRHAFDRGRRVAYHFIAKAALANARRIVPALLPHGRREGREWIALNPRRADRHLGSFRVRLDAGLWADFALNNVRGGDLISLIAYVSDISQKEAALSLANVLGVDPWEREQ
jgi:hypothetical protein